MVNNNLQLNILSTKPFLVADLEQFELGVVGVNLYMTTKQKVLHFVTSCCSQGIKKKF